MIPVGKEEGLRRFKHVEGVKYRLANGDEYFVPSMPLGSAAKKFIAKIKAIDDSEAALGELQQDVVKLGAEANAQIRLGMDGKVDDDVAKKIEQAIAKMKTLRADSEKTDGEILAANFELFTMLMDENYDLANGEKDEAGKPKWSWDGMVRAGDMSNLRALARGNFELTRLVRRATEKLSEDEERAEKKG